MSCLGSPHIAIDLGSTSIKGALLDLRANQVARLTSRPFPSAIDNVPGRVEMKLTDVVEKVREILDELIAFTDDACHIWVCGQMGGLVLCNPDGEALSNYISWRDQRSLEFSSRGDPSSIGNYLQAIRAAWPDDVWSSLGRELQPGSTSTLLYWLNQQNLLPVDVIPCSIGDYVVAHLARQRPVMHATYAIGLLDLQRVQWHHEALERIGLQKIQWPELITDLRVVAECEYRSRKLAFHGSFGDHQAALWGAGLTPQELSLNISTGSQVSLSTTDFVPGPYQSRLFFENTWLNTVTHLPAGRALNVLFGLLTELSEAEGLELRSPWETIAAKMGQVRGTDLRANVNFFSSPLGSTGSLENITTDNFQIGHLFVAACQAMADNYRVVANRLSPANDFSALVLSGGLTQSLPRLLEFIQERFPVPLRQSSGEETLLGLLKLARHYSAPSSPLP